MIGTRVSPEDITKASSPQGSYTGIVYGYTGDKPAIFYKLPNGVVGHVTSPPHSLTEHQDGSVTVSPSILHKGERKGWHGFLQNGVWTDA